MSHDLMKVAFTNAKLSSRGAIRKPHDVACWLSKMGMLVDPGLKAESAIKAWNLEATRESQLTGQKRVALLALLCAPAGTKKLLLDHASYFGSASAFSEECFAAKNLFPGFVPRSVPDKTWRSRLSITDAGFLLFLRYIDAAHHQTRADCRGKLSKERYAELSQVCQLVVSVEEELKEGGVVTSKVTDALLACEANLELELQVALSEKGMKWKPADLTLVQEILKEHSATTDSKFFVEKRVVAAGELEREEFDLMKKMFEHLVILAVAFKHDQCRNIRTDGGSKKKKIGDCILPLVIFTNLALHFTQGMTSRPLRTGRFDVKIETLLCTMLSCSTRFKGKWMHRSKPKLCSNSPPRIGLHLWKCWEVSRR